MRSELTVKMMLVAYCRIRVIGFCMYERNMMPQIPYAFGVGYGCLQYIDMYVLNIM